MPRLLTVSTNSNAKFRRCSAIAAGSAQAFGSDCLGHGLHEKEKAAGSVPLRLVRPACGRGGGFGWGYLGTPPSKGSNWNPVSLVADGRSRVNPGEGASEFFCGFGRGNLGDLEKPHVLWVLGNLQKEVKTGVKKAVEPPKIRRKIRHKIRPEIRREIRLEIRRKIRRKIRYLSALPLFLGMGAQWCASIWWRTETTSVPVGWVCQSNF